MDRAPFTTSESVLIRRCSVGATLYYVLRARYLLEAGQISSVFIGTCRGPRRSRYLLDLCMSYGIKPSQVTYGKEEHIA